MPTQKHGITTRARARALAISLGFVLCYLRGEHVHILYIVYGLSGVLEIGGGVVAEWIGGRINPINVCMRIVRASAL